MFFYLYILFIIFLLSQTKLGVDRYIGWLYALVCAFDLTLLYTYLILVELDLLVCARGFLFITLRVFCHIKNISVLFFLLLLSFYFIVALHRFLQV